MDVLFAHPRYRQTRVIDASENVQILEAEDNATHDIVAVKCFANYAIDADRLLRGCIVHRNMRHPCIVGFREVFNVPGYICMAMEYVPGLNLKQYVRKFRSQHGYGLPIEEAGRIFSQVVQAVRHMHMQNAVYRNLKPEHVLMCPDGKSVKICDLFFSRFGFVSASRVGSLHHLPPELTPDVNPIAAVGNPEHYIVGHDAVDGQKVDVWECGVLLYFVLYGTLPFTVPANGQHYHMRDIQLIQMIREQEVVFPEHPHVTEECRSLIGDMLTKNPQERIPMQAVANHPWVNQHHYEPDVHLGVVEPHQSEDMIFRAIQEGDIQGMNFICEADVQAAFSQSPSQH